MQAKYIKLNCFKNEENQPNVAAHVYLPKTREVEDEGQMLRANLSYTVLMNTTKRRPAGALASEGTWQPESMEPTGRQKESCII